MYDDENLEPVEDWHPRIDDGAYWGMDWVCPVDNQFLHDQLVKYHGNISAEITIRNMLSYVGTGDLHCNIRPFQLSHVRVLQHKIRPVLSRLSSSVLSVRYERDMERDTLNFSFFLLCFYCFVCVCVTV